MTTIAHLTDIHLPELPRPALSELSAKRFFGLMNWHWSRKFIHRMKTLDAITADLSLQEFHHLIISGDLTNLALRSEYEAGMQWLKQFKGADEVSFVPGNHDYYGKNLALYPDGTRGGELLPYMTSDFKGAELGGGNGPDLPFVRVVDNVALICLNSGIPTPLFKAYGAVSEASLAAFKRCLTLTKEAGLYRCVILHHPPLAGITSQSRGLNNDLAFQELLRKCGAELVLNGHNHKQRHDRLETKSGICHVIGTPSASVAKAGHYELARYNLFHISGTANKWETTMNGRGLLADYGEVCDLGRVEL